MVTVLITVIARFLDADEDNNESQSNNMLLILVAHTFYTQNELQVEE